MNKKYTSLTKRSLFFFIILLNSNFIYAQKSGKLLENVPENPSLLYENSYLPGMQNKKKLILPSESGPVSEKAKETEKTEKKENNFVDKSNLTELKEDFNKLVQIEEKKYENLFSMSRVYLFAFILFIFIFYRYKVKRSSKT